MKPSLTLSTEMCTVSLGIYQALQKKGMQFFRRTILSDTSKTSVKQHVHRTLIKWHDCMQDSKKESNLGMWIKDEFRIQ